MLRRIHLDIDASFIGGNIIPRKTIMQQQSAYQLQQQSQRAAKKAVAQASKEADRIKEMAAEQGAVAGLRHSILAVSQFVGDIESLQQQFIMEAQHAVMTLLHDFFNQHEVIVQLLAKMIEAHAPSLQGKIIITLPTGSQAVIPEIRNTLPQETLKNITIHIASGNTLSVEYGKKILNYNFNHAAGVLYKKALGELMYDKWDSLLQKASLNAQSLWAPESNPD